MTFSTDWFSNNVPVWEQHLSKFKDQEIYGIEIGCFEGRSTLWLVENIFTHPHAELTCIDTFEGSEEHPNSLLKNLEQRFIDNLEGYFDKITLKKGPSQMILRCDEFVPDDADFIYVDGSHQAQDVLEDLVLSWRLLKSGGILIADDYEWQEYQGTLHHPKPAIDAFLNVYAEHIHLLHKGYQVIVEKV